MLLLVLFLITSGHAQEALLRWHSGDVLSGTLLESEPGRIHWSSPLFADDIVVDMNAVNAIEFPAQAEPVTGAFRIGTITGDAFTADLIDSSDADFLFASKRHGRLRVPREAVLSLSRRAHPNLLFDGSQFRQWQRLMDGPIRNLGVKVYKGNWTWGDAFPDLADLTPLDQMQFAAGYIDLGLSRFEERFAMSFEGDIVVDATGRYRFEGAVDDDIHLWIDGKKMRNDAPIANRYESDVVLAQGSHSVRLEYVDFGGEARLSFWMINAQREYTSLAEGNQTSGWQQGVSGTPQTSRAQACLKRAVELPDRYDIDLELASSGVPQFALAIGMEQDGSESADSLRLETWNDELVVVQDEVFEPVMTLERHVQEVRLRLVVDSNNQTCQVFDASGRLLVNAKGVLGQTGQSGIMLRNRGEDLTVRRLNVYRWLNTPARQAFHVDRARVHLIDGQVVYGQLYVTDGVASVVDQVGTRREIDLDMMDHIANPGAALLAAANVSELKFADGAMVRGRATRINADEIVLHTAFSSDPVTCALANASLLRFGAQQPRALVPMDDLDELFTAAGRLRGRLSFDGAGAPLTWHLPGAVKPVRLTSGGAGRIERRSQSVTQGPIVAWDTDRFPRVLHLRNGEIIPCQVLSYDRDTLGFESPSIMQRTIDSQTIKAIEFSPLTRQEAELDVDPVKLERALTVPRFHRSSPPTHVLMAKNGDLMRGRLLGAGPQSIRFESKLRTHVIPVERLKCVVNVSRLDPDPNAPLKRPANSSGKVLASLSDGSILIFDPVESRDGELLGRSSIYGDVKVPCDLIQDLTFGGFETELQRSRFRAWLVRPARAPAFHDPSQQ